MSRPAAPLLDCRNTNALWGSVLVETFFRLGGREAVISPGSRSTPLTLAFARHPGIEAIPLLDERSAGFFALGLAKARRRPVVLLCTSGTAGANYYPAVIEAQEGGVPLIVLTADRPPEMRDCRSGQTIDQQKLFGSHVNFFHELAVPAASVAMLRYLRQTVAHAWDRANGPAAGPVHLNAPFRDPLAPVRDERDGPLDGLVDAREFFAGLAPLAMAGPAPAAPLRLGATGIMVAGQATPADPVAYARTVGRLALRLGWPVLADVLSPLRNHARLVPTLVTNYEAMARSATWTQGMVPAQVLCLHDWPTSKTLRQWLGAGDPEVILVGERTGNADALHGRSRILRSAVEAVAKQVRSGPRQPAWLRSWLAADRRAGRALARALPAREGMFEGRVAALLPGLLPAGTTVMVANSMPVRDAEYFWPANNRAHVVHCNRGANGIDGTLSTALGLAHGQGPALLLTGDLALLHDTNGLLGAAQFRGSLTIVLINNRGGGIFEHLPVAQFRASFEKYFATPQTVDFARLASAYGVKHVPVRDWAHFERLVRQLPRRGIRLLELGTDRAGDAARRRELLEAAAAQL